MSKLAYPQRQKQLQQLATRLGLSGQEAIDWALMDLALTHPTASAKDNYEQLEFLGDAVVRLAAAEVLFETYPQSPVGEFAALRSILVSDRVLATIADSYGLEQYLILSNSALKDKTGYQSRMAQSLEALIAALYLSTHTLELVRPWLDSHFQKSAITILADPARQNYKAALQEWSQGVHKLLPEYHVTELPPSADSSHRHQGDTEHRFYAEVSVGDTLLGKGTGRSRKAAEQAAAQVAFCTVQSATAEVGIPAEATS